MNGRTFGCGATAALAIAVLAGCGAEPGEAPAGAQIAYGSEVSLGAGTARTYVVTEDGSPTELGVAIDEAFMQALPADGAEGGMMMPDGHSLFEYLLDLPADNPTPFRHVTLDWNPAGHEPPGIYDRAHFDVHFYTITNEDRLTIDPARADFMERAAHEPPPELVPAGFIDPGLPPVPMMGRHFLDPTSPELHPEEPEPFTYTFLYGVWDGRLIFMEPMVTTAFLETRPDVRVPFGQPERWEQPGHYPGAYTVRWDEGTGEYRIALVDFSWRE